MVVASGFSTRTPAPAANAASVGSAVFILHGGNDQTVRCRGLEQFVRTHVGIDTKLRGCSCRDLLVQIGDPDQARPEDARARFPRTSAPCTPPRRHRSAPAPRCSSRVLVPACLQAAPAALDDTLHGFAEGIERKDDQRQRQTRKEAIPPGAVEKRLARAQHLSPGGRWWFDAETEE